MKKKLKLKRKTEIERELHGARLTPTNIKSKY